MGLLTVLVYLGFPLLIDGMSFASALRRRADNFPGLAFLVAAIAFVVITFRSEKFVEYSVPFSFLAGATSLRSMRKPALLALIVVMSTATLLFGSQDLRELRRRPVLFTPDSTETFRKIIPEGAQVFTCGWEVTGEMMIALPERKFLAALNPVFLWANDANLYHAWFDVVQHPTARAVNIIRSRFHAGFVLCEARAEHLALIERLSRSPGVRAAHRIGPWVLFVLDDPRDAPSGLSHEQRAYGLMPLRRRSTVEGGDARGPITPRDDQSRGESGSHWVPATPTADLFGGGFKPASLRHAARCGAAGGAREGRPSHSRIAPLNPPPYGSAAADDPQGTCHIGGLSDLENPACSACPPLVPPLRPVRPIRPLIRPIRRLSAGFTIETSVVVPPYSGPLSATFHTTGRSTGGCPWRRRPHARAWSPPQPPTGRARARPPSVRPNPAVPS
jgi:hypothetical protein